ncbi:MAG: aminotransferase class I/II-fold pyridoxal phosphate-dependent enzyme, partial [Proteobacteria bacterium]|nr:aminotransferase class I/II-fold pyridoxal phosphate-dependent enzyme [Pseudomonadota bacterium]
RSWLAAELKGLGLAVLPSSANFVMTRFAAGAVQAAAALAHLAGDGILVRGMGPYGLHDCLRITVGDERSMRALVKSLGEFLEAAE